MDAIAHLQLPSVAAWAVRSVHICHFLGRALSRLELRRQNPGLYLAGVLTNARFGDREFLRVAAQLVRLAQVFFSVVEESGKLVQSSHRLSDSFSFLMPLSIPYAQNRLARKQWALQEGHAPSVLFLPWPVNYVASRVMLIAMRIAEIVSCIWQLNLLLFDLYDTVWMDPYTRASAIDDLFINFQEVAEQFVSPERRLSRAIAAHGLWVDELLKIVHVNWTAEKLALILNEFADRAEGVGRIFAVPAQAIATMAQGSSAITSAMMTNYSTNTIS
jgi:hypothetical protein